MLEINIQENSQDKLQILCVFAVFLFLMYKLCMGLSVSAVDTIDLLDYISVQTDSIKVGDNSYILTERIGATKYMRDLPDEFGF